MAARPTAPAAKGEIHYRGGFVHLTSQVFLIFWGTWWDTHHMAQRHALGEFFRGTGTTGWIRILEQYYTDHGLTGGRDYIQFNITSLLLGGSMRTGSMIDNTDPPAAPTDRQLAAVARQAWNGPLNNLANSWGDGLVPVIVLPPGSISEVDRTPHTRSGFRQCGHHNWAWDRLDPGSSDPWQPITWVETSWDQSTDPSCNYGHGATGGLTITLGHEYAETVTDPYIGDGVVKDPSGGVWTGAVGFAWYNGKAGQKYAARPRGEVGDPCRADYDIFQLALSTGHFWVQALWSNKAGGCVKRK